MGKIEEEVRRLTVDAGARRCGQYLDQQQAQIDGCCGSDRARPPTEPHVEAVSREPDELDALRRRIAVLEFDVRELKARLQPVSPTTPS